MLKLCNMVPIIATAPTTPTMYGWMTLVTGRNDNFAFAFSTLFQRIQLLNTLEFENDEVSRHRPWHSPSNYLKEWCLTARIYFTRSHEVSSACLVVPK